MLCSHCLFAGALRLRAFHIYHAIDLALPLRWCSRLHVQPSSHRRHPCPSLQLQHQNKGDVQEAALAHRRTGGSALHRSLHHPGNPRPQEQCLNVLHSRSRWRVKSVKGSRRTRKIRDRSLRSHLLLRGECRGQLRRLQTQETANNHIPGGSRVAIS